MPLRPNFFAVLLAWTVSACQPVATPPEPVDPATHTVSTLGPVTASPALNQALSSGQPISVTQHDPNGQWQYAVSSKGAGDLKLSFQLGGVQPQTHNASALHQQVNARIAANRARHAKRQQAMRQRLAKMKSQGSLTATAPLQASFSIHIDGNMDPDVLKAKLAQMQQQSALGQGTPTTRTVTWHKSPQPNPTPSSLGSPPGGQAGHTAVAIPIPVAAPATKMTATSNGAGQPITSATALDHSAIKDAIEETAELYLWLGASGDLEEAQALVVDRCRDEAVGRVAAITFLDAPFEMTESQVIATKVRSQAATVTYDVTGTLTSEGEQGEPIANAVNLTGELQLVATDDGWFVTCPE